MENENICPVKIVTDNAKPLFVINAPYDNAAVLTERKYLLCHLLGRFSMLTAIAAFIMAVASAILKFYLITIITGIVFFMMLLPVITLKKSAAASYEKFYKDENFRQYSFYDKYFTVEDSRGAFYITYDRLKNAARFKEYIILCTEEEKTYTIAGKYLPDGFIDFITERTKKI